MFDMLDPSGASQQDPPTAGAPKAASRHAWALCGADGVALPHRRFLMVFVSFEFPHFGSVKFTFATKRRLEASFAPAQSPVVADDHTVSAKIHDQRRGLLEKFERMYGFD